MLNYILVLFADIGYTLGFSGQKLYEKNEGNNITDGLKFNVITGIASVIVAFLLCGFCPQYTHFSMLYSLMQMFLLTGYTMIGFYILKQGSMSLYTLFLMSGGMLVPYVWGVAFLGEELTVLRSVGVVVITIAVALTNLGKNKISKLVLVLCVMVFFINGLTGVLAKIHQTQTTYAIASETSTIFWGAVCKIIVCTIAYLCVKQKIQPTRGGSSIKAIAISSFAALSTNTGEIILLFSAEKVPASVLFPLITGGTIILSAIAGRIFFKEKISGKQVVAIVLCLAGTCMFL